ncbi:MAG: hypothetical protein U0836_24150 [Pirellulales bacterium]
MNEPSASIRALLDRAAEPRSLTSRDPLENTDDSGDYRAFAGGRIGNRTQWTLMFQSASGAVRCFPYSHFEGLRSDDPAAGFIVTFAGVEVEVSGRHLGPLVQALCEHRAASIVEAGRAQRMLLSTETAVVENVGFRDRGLPRQPPR